MKKGQLPYVEKSFNEEIILMRNSVDQHQWPEEFELHLSLSFKVAQKKMTNGEAF